MRHTAILRHFCRNARGATAVEFALVAAPFLALLIACLQVGLVYLSQSALEVATEKAARLVLIGSVQNSGQSQQQFLDTVCSKLPALLNCSNLSVDATTYSSFSAADTSRPTIAYDSNGKVNNAWNYDLGNAGDIVVLRVIYLLPVVGGPLGFLLANTQNNKRVLMAIAVFRNEPYQ